MISRLVSVSVLLAAFSAGANAACVEHKVLDGILRANVDADGYVKYDDIRINKGGDLGQYLSEIEIADLSACMEKEKFVFWMNAYNAHMINMILARPAMKSMREDFKLFNQPIKVARIHVTLNDIEHRIIRSSTKNGGPIAGYSLAEFDPRVHFCIANGAVDARLLNRAYNVTGLEEALQQNAEAFANNPKNIRIENDKLIINNIVRWYEGDFKNKNGVPVFLSSLLDSNQRDDADAIKAKLATDYPATAEFRFDWTVNNVKNKPKQ